MKKHKINKIWIPFWVDKWLFGSTRLELEPDERSVWLDLLALASKNEGFVRANETTPYHNSQLAGLLVISEELLKRTIEKCAEYGKITQLENGTYQIANWEKYQLSGRHKRRFKPKKSRKEKSKKEKNKIENKREEKRASKETDAVSDNKDIPTDKPLTKWKDRRHEEVQEIMDYAKQQGFALQGSDKTNRQYAYNLWRKKGPNQVPLGVVVVKQLIDIAIACRGEAYAPQVNDFKQMFYKWGDMLSFVDKKKKTGRIG